MKTNSRCILRCRVGMMLPVLIVLLPFNKTLLAQSKESFTDASPAGAADPSSLSIVGSRTSWKAYEKVQDNLVPLEEESLTRLEDANGRYCITFPLGKSPVRASADSIFVAKGSNVDRQSFPVTISRVRVVNGQRGVCREEMARVKLQHGFAGQDTFTLTPLDGLTPGEYVVTIKLGDDVSTGDVSFLFGVD